MCSKRSFTVDWSEGEQPSPTLHETPAISGTWDSRPLVPRASSARLLARGHSVNGGLSVSGPRADSADFNVARSRIKDLPFSRSAKYPIPLSLPSFLGRHSVNLTGQLDSYYILYLTFIPPPVPIPLLVHFL